MTIASRQTSAVETSAPGVERATSELFKVGMRRLASGIGLITTFHEGRPHGFVATSVTSVSAVPPSLLVCANQNASAHDPIEHTGRFCVSLLGQRDKAIAAQFGSSSRRDERFTQGDWMSLPSGPLALRSAMTWFDCVIEERIRHHSHSIFLARVIDVGIGEQEMPLVYFDQHYLEM
ncbi:flavin reductase family protein [Ancylobacter sp. VNQ12]|uniref:flavin reductase family protein n=1 Tax=Ancylobacter sp. VNQ12 TaxID=3400920 RepID=UPI003BFE8E4A